DGERRLDCRAFADVGVLRAHFIRSEGVPGSSPGVGCKESSAQAEFLFGREPRFWRGGRTRVARASRISSSADAGSASSSSSKTCPYVLSAIDGEWPAWRATSTMLLRSAIRSDTNEWRRS